MITAIDEQSPDIAQGVDKAYEARTDPADDDEKLDVAGAGDQGMMFGYACAETKELMPMPISLGAQARAPAGRSSPRRPDAYLRPDSKSQVTVEYESGNRSDRDRTSCLDAAQGRRTPKTLIEAETLKALCTR